MQLERALRPALACLLSAVALGGCGLDQGAGTTRATILITHGFGTEVIGTATQSKVPAAETDLQLLREHFRIQTRDRGRIVVSVDGAAADDAASLGWFVYVNGIIAGKSLNVSRVHDGDRIWLDLHNDETATSVPAVVGSYPAPFADGVGGQRFPTVLQCASDAGAACGTVARTLRRAGVKVADQLIGGGSGSDSLAVLVGTFEDLRGVIAAELLAAGPSQSGVYAQFSGPHEGAIELDNPQGQVVRTLRGSAGLVAATEQPGLNEPAWLITGTDRAGVDAAARALSAAALRDHLAVAVAHGRILGLPLDPTAR